MRVTHITDGVWAVATEVLLFRIIAFARDYGLSTPGATSFRVDDPIKAVSVQAVNSHGMIHAGAGFVGGVLSFRVRSTYPQCMVAWAGNQINKYYSV